MTVLFHLKLSEGGLILNLCNKTNEEGNSSLIWVFRFTESAFMTNQMVFHDSNSETLEQKRSTRAPERQIRANLALGDGCQ